MKDDTLTIDDIAVYYHVSGIELAAIVNGYRESKLYLFQTVEEAKESFMMEFGNV